MCPLFVHGRWPRSMGKTTSQRSLPYGWRWFVPRFQVGDFMRSTYQVSQICSFNVKNSRFSLTGAFGTGALAADMCLKLAPNFGVPKSKGINFGTFLLLDN